MPLDKETASAAILDGKTFLGIELGSGRIKAVLITKDHQLIASGSHAWENRLEDGMWTYKLDDVWQGLAACFADLKENIDKQYHVSLQTVGAMGISAMMHGYMPFDKNDKLLTAFRTWRNTTTSEAADELTQMFLLNIPQRWSIAHVYQAILNKEAHVKDLRFLTTLAGYVHWQLTGKKVLGVGDASGMFPIDATSLQYDAKSMQAFDKRISDKKYPWRLADLLPDILLAGAPAGCLTQEGALKLDPSGTLKPGAAFCPPEGDAGTGMVATNSVRARTGNVSAGTSVFAMVVLQDALSKVHPEIDCVTTPTGRPVAMVHCNNCLSDLDAWVHLFGDVLNVFGARVDTPTLYEILYEEALEGDPDAGGLLAYNYVAGEHVTGFTEGRPLFVRRPDSPLTLKNFMRTHLFTTLGALRCGLDVLFEQEKIDIDQIMGHGGLFKTPKVGQTIIAAALNTPVSVCATAGEGGPWGMALLAAYLHQRSTDETLETYLDNRVFCEAISTTVMPKKQDVDGFNTFIKRYKKGLAIEKVAIESLN